MRHVSDRPADLWLWRSNATGAHERLNLTPSTFDALASPAAARPRLPRNQHRVSPIGGICRTVPSSHIPARQLPRVEGHQPQGITHDQSEARSPYTADLAGHLH